MEHKSKPTKLNTHPVSVASEEPIKKGAIHLTEVEYEETEMSQEAEVEVEVAPAPVIKNLTPLQIEKTLRLAQDMRLVTGESLLLKEKLAHFTYEERLIQKDKLLLDKNLEISQLKKRLAATEQLELDNRLSDRRKTYADHLNSISVHLGIDFTKCSFDPTTGVVEVLN